MIITVTIKLTAESRDELINVFGSNVREFREHCEALRQGAVFGPPEKVELRYLIIGGEWRELPDVITTAEPGDPNDE